MVSRSVSAGLATVGAIILVLGLVTLPGGGEYLIIIGLIILVIGLAFLFLQSAKTFEEGKASTFKEEEQKINIDKDVSNPVTASGLKYCFKCGKKIVSDAKLCPYCGTAQNHT
jgi:thiamine transporter ThiT